MTVITAPQAPSITIITPENDEHTCTVHCIAAVYCFVSGLSFVSCIKLRASSKQERVLTLGDAQVQVGDGNSHGLEEGGGTGFRNTQAGSPHKMLRKVLPNVVKTSDVANAATNVAVVHVGNGSRHKSVVA